MASLNFPTAPADQQTYSANGITYQYDAAKSRWDIVPPTVEFETSAQLDIRDTANRSRSNHTGTQTASTISDFDTEVSNNTDVAANTSARHDAVTVVDSSEIDFTLTGQQITASIVAGSIDESKLDASVNASLDLADSSVQLTGDQSIAGTKTFTTALILPNNSRVNGVEHFYQTSKPTVRGDASALVAGDRWWKTDDGTEWFWNGTYWTGIPESARHVLSGVNWISTPSSDTRFSMMLQHSAIMDSVELVMYSNAYFGSIDASNHFILNISYTQNAGSWINFSSIPTYNTFTGVGDLYSRTYAGETAIGDRHIIIPIGQVVGFSLESVVPTFRGIRVSATQVGTPGGNAFRVTECVLNYRRIL